MPGGTGKKCVRHFNAQETSRPCQLKTQNSRRKFARGTRMASNSDWEEKQTPPDSGSAFTVEFFLEPSRQILKHVGEIGVLVAIALDSLARMEH